jgi:hypothetical protein
VLSGDIRAVVESDAFFKTAELGGGSPSAILAMMALLSAA